MTPSVSFNRSHINKYLFFQHCNRGYNTRVTANNLYRTNHQQRRKKQFNPVDFFNNCFEIQSLGLCKLSTRKHTAENTWTTIMEKEGTNVYSQVNGEFDNIQNIPPISIFKDKKTSKVIQKVCLYVFFNNAKTPLIAIGATGGSVVKP